MTTLFEFLTNWRAKTPKGSLVRDPAVARVDARCERDDIRGRVDHTPHVRSLTDAHAGTIEIDPFELINGES
jgi:hypothetical protein